MTQWQIDGQAQRWIGGPIAFDAGVPSTADATKFRQLVQARSGRGPVPMILHFSLKSGVAPNLGQWPADAVPPKNFDAIAGERYVDASIPINYSWSGSAVVRATYGAGGITHVRHFDARDGSYAFPPCEELTVDFLAYDAALATTAQASIVEGHFLNARTPVLTMYASIGNGSIKYLVPPAGAVAIDLQGSAPAAWAAAPQLRLTSTDSPLIERDYANRVFTPAYGPVPLLSWNHSTGIGVENFGTAISTAFVEFELAF